MFPGPIGSIISFSSVFYRSCVLSVLIGGSNAFFFRGSILEKHLESTERSTKDAKRHED
jgi:hypothetical protein